MERHEGPQTPFEVYCYHCKATFAVGTPRCVHCGRRVGGRPGRPGRDEPALAVSAPEVDAPETSLTRRLGGMSLWVLLALGAALTRMCSEG